MFNRNVETCLSLRARVCIYARMQTRACNHARTHTDALTDARTQVYHALKAVIKKKYGQVKRRGVSGVASVSELPSACACVLWSFTVFSKVTLHAHAHTHTHIPEPTHGRTCTRTHTHSLTPTQRLAGRVQRWRRRWLRAQHPGQQGGPLAPC